MPLKIHCWLTHNRSPTFPFILQLHRCWCNSYLKEFLQSAYTAITFILKDIFAIWHTKQINHAISYYTLLSDLEWSSSKIFSSSLTVFPNVFSSSALYSFGSFRTIFLDASSSGALSSLNKVLQIWTFSKSEISNSSQAMVIWLLS